MTCNQCHGSGPKKMKCGHCTPPVIEIKNPPEATLFHRVDVPASMGDETEYPPEAGLYKNTLLHYEASNNSYLYSSDGIPTKVNGVDGKDGAIQYTAGDGIDISDQNVISATGSIAVAWGDITGDLSNQTDLDNALGAKQDTLTAGANITIDGNNEISATDTTYTAGTNVNISSSNVISATDTTYSNFVGTDGVTAGVAGLVPGPATTEAGTYLKADGTWATPPGTTYSAGTNIQITGTTISATDTTYTAGNGLSLNGTEFSVDTTTIQPKLTAGANINIDANNEISATDTTYNDFVGTDGVSAGTHGLVPAPATTDANAFLKGDGTWGTPPGTTYTAGANIQINGSTISATDTTYTHFTGTDGQTDGTQGLVPGPLTTDVNKFLNANGTWQTPPNTTYTAGRRITIDANNEISADGLITLSYGHSTWNDFITAYTNNEVVYCRASSGSNPGVGAQTRLAFMAYVNNETNPTEVEFQYVRSVSTKSASNQSDNVFVYKLTNADGGTWTVETRPVMVKISAGTNMTSSYSNNVLTLNSTGTTYTAGANITIDANNEISATDTTYSDFTGATSGVAGASGLVPAPSAGDEGKVLLGDGTWADIISPSVVPVVNTATSNTAVNSAQWYNQYSYQVPSDGIYIVTFSQRMTNGSNSYDFNVRVTLNGTEVSSNASGGSTYVNYISPVVTCAVSANAGDTIACQSKGGGSGTFSTNGGRVSIVKVVNTNLSQASGSIITMTDTDPGEGQPLAPNNFVAVYSTS